MGRKLKYGFNTWSQSNFKRYSLLTKDAAKFSGWGWLKYGSSFTRMTLIFLLNRVKLSIGSSEFQSVRIISSTSSNWIHEAIDIDRDLLLFLHADIIETDILLTNFKFGVI